MKNEFARPIQLIKDEHGFVIGREYVNELKPNSMSKEEDTVICCPMCSGKGKVNYKHHLSVKQNEMRLKSITAKQLRKDGYSIRQIMRALNYNSSQGVVDLLKKEHK